MPHDPTLVFVASCLQLDELAVVYSSAAPPNISNDTITIDKRQAADPQVRGVAG